MRIKLKQDKDTILRILKSDDIAKKLKVLDRLDGVNEKDTIKILIKMLDDKSWCMREKAAHKLAEYGPRISGRLQRLLKKGYWYTTVIKEASNALLNLARKKPEKFATRLADMELHTSKLRTVMFVIERADIELYDKIRTQLVDEREV
jgi:hypothetical protein